MNKFKLSLKTVAGASFCFIAVTHAGHSIYHENFSGQSTVSLNGSAPDIRPGAEIWTSNEKYKADGSFLFSSESTSARAWLPVTIEAGKIYKLELTGTLTPGGTASQSIGVAFTSDRGDISNNLLSSARMMAAVILRNSGSVEAFANANDGSSTTAVGSSLGNSISGSSLCIVLSTYTDDTKWKADYYINDTLIGTYTWDTTPTAITRVAISTGTSSGNLAGTFHEFRLNDITAEKRLSLILISRSGTSLPGCACPIRF
jgi:hypothetical protein